MSMENVPPEADGKGVSAGAIAALGSGVLLVVFMLQNTDEVPVTFLFWDVTWPIWLIVLVSAGLGAFIWLGAGIMRRHRRRKERRHDRRD